MPYPLPVQRRQALFFGAKIAAWSPMVAWSGWQSSDGESHLQIRWRGKVEMANFASLDVVLLLIFAAET